MEECHDYFKKFDAIKTIKSSNRLSCSSVLIQGRQLSQKQIMLCNKLEAGHYAKSSNRQTEQKNKSVAMVFREVVAKYLVYQVYQICNRGRMPPKI